jgi:uncharacterized protein YjcR
MDNTHDMMKKGRHKWIPVPIEYIAKLNYQKAEQIRKNKNKLSTIELAKIYGVSPSTIKQVKSGKTWRRKNVEMER